MQHAAADDPDEDDADRTVMQRPPPAPSQLPAPEPDTSKRLLCSVGRYGVNYADDVVLVRALLAIALPEPVPPTGPERRCDERLVAAIEQYQSTVLGMAPPYGRIDPAGSTSEALGAG